MWSYEMFVLIFTTLSKHEKTITRICVTRVLNQVGNPISPEHDPIRGSGHVG